MSLLPVAAIVLCAGQSQRMGQPKALLVWQGRTFLARVVDLARAQQLAPIVVIEGAHGLAEEIRELGVAGVHHAAWANGPLSSLQVGLTWCMTQGFVGAGTLVLTVDRPRTAHATLVTLLEQVACRPDMVWQPAYLGKRAHPIYLPRASWRAILDHPPTGTLRDVLDASPWHNRRASFECGDPAVIENLDTPQALVAAGITIDET